MKIACIGGGPAGLYFSILMKKAFPESEITVYERNKADDTFGWGVVFSDETLGNFEEADPESFAEITASFAYWTDIETYYADTCVRSTGHGFCGLSRKKLLQIFHGAAGSSASSSSSSARCPTTPSFARCRPDRGLRRRSTASFRERYAEHFQPSLDWRKCKFTWLGTTKPLDAFTFIFKENEHGLFQVHAYPFEVGDDPLSTFIVECREDVWRAPASTRRTPEEETVRYFQDLFADHLDGHPAADQPFALAHLPDGEVRETWHHDNIVLIGDSAHTAHFSIGSGTKLAMEDAIALVDAFASIGTEDVPAVPAAYEDERWVDVIKLQKAAQTSLEWFENSARYMGRIRCPSPST